MRTVLVGAADGDCPPPAPVKYADHGISDVSIALVVSVRGRRGTNTALRLIRAESGQRRRSSVDPLAKH